MIDAPFSTPAVAIFDEAGALAYLAPADHVPADGFSAVALPDGYDPVRDRWDEGTRQMLAFVPGLRAEAWALVKAARDKAEWGGCTTMLGRVDTDPDSQRKVSGSVQMAMIAQAAGAPFALDWTMQDNSTVRHDAPAMIAMGVAVGRHVAACHEVALGKREAIELAADAAAIAAIDIEGGWPDAPAS